MAFAAAFQPGLRWWLAVAAIGVLAAGIIFVPGLRSQPFADDFGVQAVMAGTFPAKRSALEAYAAVRSDRREVIQLVDRGVLPWWSEEDFFAVGLRPGASALLALDHRLSLSPGAQHLHSLAWWVALLVAFAALARELLSARTALLSVALFAVHPAHAIPLGWVANRGTLVSATFSLVAIWGHWRWRERSWRPGLALSIVGCMGALFVSEYGLGALAFVLAYELFGARGTRWRGALGVGFGAAAYLAVRMLAHAGVRGAFMYSDPLVEPLRFLLHASARLPALAGDLFLRVPSERSVTSMRALPLELRAVLALAVIAATIWICRTLYRSGARSFGWIAVGTILSTLPLLAAEPASRLLVLPCAGSSLLLAALAAHLATQSLVSRAAAALIIGVHGVVAAVSAAAASRAWEQTTARAAESVFASDVNTPDAGSRCFVVLNTRDWLTLHGAPFMLAAERGAFPRCWFVLAASLGRIEVTRPAADVIELTALDGSLLDMLGGAFAIRPASLPSNAFLALQPRLRPRVVAVTGAGPTRAQFRASFPLDAADVTFVAWQGDRLRRTALPRVGQSRALP
jgi:hypothetical protein